MNYSLDIAAILASIMWPLMTLIVLLAYRKKLPALTEALTNRITKVEFAGVGLELAIAKPYQPDAEKTAGSAEFWHKAAHTQVNDSYAQTFFHQLTEGGLADYAEINLAEGQAWLTSRLYIISILYAQIKGIKAFAFVETANNIRKRYTGWARVENVRWTLAMRYPWLEKAYLEAYNQMLTNGSQISSETGRLGYVYDLKGPGASINLLQEFLQRVQAPSTPPDTNTLDWAFLDTTPPSFEHAQWVTGELLEGILGNYLNTGYVRSSELRAKPAKEQSQMIVSMTGEYVAVTTDDYRFEYLLDRHLLLE